MYIMCCYCRKTIKSSISQICEGCMVAAKLVINKEDKMSLLDKKAHKYDQDKPPLDLIPYSALELEARVLAFGAKKYDRNQWRKGMDWSQLLAAAMRHIGAFNAGEDIDTESGLSHLGHARCCLGFLIEYQKEGLGIDDRYRVKTDA